MPAATWEDLRAAAQKLTDKGSGVYGIVIPPQLERFGAFVFQAGGRLVSDDGTRIALNSPEGLQALQFYYALYKDGLPSTPSDTGTEWPGDAFSMPNAKPAVATLCIFAFRGAWNDFLDALIFISGANRQSFTLPLGLAQFQNFYYTDWPVVMAGAVLTTLPIALVYVFFQRYWVEGIATTGPK